MNWTSVLILMPKIKYVGDVSKEIPFEISRETGEIYIKKDIEVARRIKLARDRTICRASIVTSSKLRLMLVQNYLRLDTPHQTILMFAARPY
jgi:hypothetical protein